MDDPNKPQTPVTNPPVEPTPTPPQAPAPVPAPTPMPGDPAAQSTLPPITHAHTFSGGKAVFAGASALVLVLVGITVVLVTQQSAKSPTTTNTAAQTYTAPSATPSPTMAPDSPEGVNSIDVGTGDEGVPDIKNDVNQIQ